MLGDRGLGPAFWLGQSDRGDEHLLALHGFKAPATGRSVRRLPMRLRSSADAVRELHITSWDTGTSI